MDSTASLDKLKTATKTTAQSLKARSLQQGKRIESNPRGEQIIDSPPVKKSIQPFERKESTEKAEGIDEPENRLAGVNLAELWAPPSAFARILVDCRDGAPAFPSELPDSSPEPVVSAFDFSKPSPDDVVLKAQNFKGPR